MSSGVASLDGLGLLLPTGVLRDFLTLCHLVIDLVGGGHAVGTVVLVEEDRNTKYAELLLKYFLAEGIAHDNAVCLISADESPATFLECKAFYFKLPPLVSH